MKRKKGYIEEEHERIEQIIAKIDDIWILGQIYKVIVNMTKEDGARNG